MNYIELEKHVNSKQLKSVYLFWGEEEYLMSNIIKKIKKTFDELILGINYVVLDETSISNLISDIETPAFGFEKKLIIINDSKLLKKDGRKKTLTPIQEKILNYFKENMNIINDSVIIIFKEKDVDKNEIFAQIDKVGITCNFTELKPVEIIPRIKKICNGYNVSINDLAINHLIEISGTNLQNLINEIRKLIEYKQSGNSISIEDIDLLATKQIESIIFELTDNLALKKTDKSLEILNNLIYQKEPIQKILVTLYNHFKKLYLYSMSVKFNKDPILALNLKQNQVFLVNKYRNQVKYFNLKTLREILEKFADLDYLSKNGKIDLETGLKSLLCFYCS
ncbi:MAG: DNA polymerase III subunit delta [Candidatus Scatovivens sp.]